VRPALAPGARDLGYCKLLLRRLAGEGMEKGDKMKLFKVCSSSTAVCPQLFALRLTQQDEQETTVVRLLHQLAEDEQCVAELVLLNGVAALQAHINEIPKVRTMSSPSYHCLP
jgi:hypothetical protein